MARGDARDLFFRELRNAGLSRPAVEALVRRFEALETGGSAGSSSVAWTAVKTANYTASAGDAVPADASGGDFVVTLPAPTANARVTVKNVGATGAVSVHPHAAETIDGAASHSITPQWTSRDFQADGTNWLVV